MTSWSPPPPICMGVAARLAALEILYIFVTPLPCSEVLCKRYIESRKEILYWLWFIECLSNVLLEDGWRFLYRKQHEQQKHETKVIINRAAKAPTIIPTYTVKLQKYKTLEYCGIANRKCTYSCTSDWMTLSFLVQQYLCISVPQQKTSLLSSEFGQ